VEKLHINKWNSFTVRGKMQNQLSVAIDTESNAFFKECGTTSFHKKDPSSYTVDLFF